MDEIGFSTSKPMQIIAGARILSPEYDPAVRYDIRIQDGKIQDVHLTNPGLDPLIFPNIFHAHDHLIAPSLCHAHIHLDKCFLLSDPKFADLEIVNGDFAEAMALTSKAKARFQSDDLIQRGKWLITESVAAGVTHMRAFVEVDHVVEFKCLDASVQLKELFAEACEIQICVFAQEPLFSGPHCKRNKSLMEEALRMPGIAQAVGSTPYVEDSETHIRDNIKWAVSWALEHNMHLDLHLDYNLDHEQKPWTLFLATCLKDFQPYPGALSTEYQKTITLGHCTRLTSFSVNEWQNLTQSLEGLPFHFVGLPTSDLYIQGRPSAHEGGGERPRGTLQIPQMIQQYDIQGAIAINNVGNAFTPYGSCDPLSIASMGVGLYHAGTKHDAQILYECVSTRAKRAIGYPSSPFAHGASADFVLFDVGGATDNPISKQRVRKTLQEIIYDPPKERKTMFKGRLVSI